MKIIDAHLHIWDITNLHYPWLQTLNSINKTFLLNDYTRATKGYDIESMVFVQCECLPEEALQELDFVHRENKHSKRIKAITAYAPVEKGKAMESYLQLLLKDPLVKAVRRMTDEEPGLCLTKDFLEGMQLLAANDLSFELSIKPNQAAETLALIEQCPQNNFILDHLGKPAIASNGFNEYKKNITQFAAHSNVTAKVSGLITEANPHTWTKEQIQPYIEFAFEKFGFDRLMFGSDWPVVLLAGSFTKWIDTLLEITYAARRKKEANCFTLIQKISIALNEAIFITCNLFIIPACNCTGI